MGHTRFFARSLAISAFAAIALACTAASTDFRTSDMKFVSAEISFTKGRNKTIVRISSFEVCPVGGKKFCDVQISYVVDANLDGDFDDPGDTRQLIYSGIGEFKSFKKKRSDLLIPRNLEQAVIQVTGIPCDNKKKGKRKVLLSALVTRNGPQRGPIPQPTYDGFALAGGTDSPHFVEFRRERGSSNKFRIFVGDLRGETTPHASIYRRLGLAKKKDFLGALIFVNDQLLDIIVGEGSRTLPLVTFPLAKLQVLSFDRAFRLVGNWKFENFRM